MSMVHDIVYTLAAAVSSPIWGYRLLKTGKWRTDWASRLGKVDPLPPLAATAPRTQTLLIHAVSVGEVNAIRRLVDLLAADPASAHAGPPPLRIIVSVTTDTGLRRARELFAAKHIVVRYPLDFTRSVRRFLDAVRPDVVALTELEVWPNFVAQCRRRNIPVCVINGRLSARSFANYRKVRPLVAPTFGRLDQVMAQTPAYAERFVALGAPAERVRVLDTMKWDTVQVVPPGAGADPVAAITGAADLAREMGLDRTRPIIVAGSTGPGEERLLIDTCPPEAQLVLVPRKPERFNEVAALDPAIVRRTVLQKSAARDDAEPFRAGSAGASSQNQPRLFLLDTMGELRQAYALADVCIVGRSFLGLYGSDMMEPAALGKPVLVGPCHSDFQDTVDALVAGEGIIVTDRPGAVAAELLADRPRAQRLAEAGRRVILSRQGATQRHADRLRQLLATVARP